MQCLLQKHRIACAINTSTLQGRIHRVLVQATKVPPGGWQSCRQQWDSCTTHKAHPPTCAATMYSFDGGGFYTYTRYPVDINYQPRWTSSVVHMTKILAKIHFKLAYRMGSRSSGPYLLDLVLMQRPNRYTESSIPHAGLPVRMWTIGMWNSTVLSWFLTSPVGPALRFLPLLRIRNA